MYGDSINQHEKTKNFNGQWSIIKKILIGVLYKEVPHFKDNSHAGRWSATSM